MIVARPLFLGAMMKSCASRSFGRLLAVVLPLLVLGGCAKHTQTGVVLSKEYRPPAPVGEKSGAKPEMIPEVWVVNTRLRDGLTFSAYVEHAQWLRLEIGDRVRVTYKQGKYTHTVWTSTLEKIP